MVTVNSMIKFLRLVDGRVRYGESSLQGQNSTASSAARDVKQTERTHFQLYSSSGDHQITADGAEMQRLLPPLCRHEPFPPRIALVCMTTVTENPD